MKPIQYIDTTDIISDAQEIIKFSKTETNSSNFKSSYFRALNKIQELKFSYDENLVEPMLNFNVSGNEEKLVLATFGSQDNLDLNVNNCQFSKEEQTLIAENWHKGLTLIKSFDLDLWNLVNTIDAQFLFAKTGSHLGGSFWYLIGVIWMSPKLDHWKPEDYAENILHETIHQCMFLKDMVHTLFSKDITELAQENALVKSAIREVDRPYDFAFHAATVSVALVKFYEFLGNQDKADKFKTGSIETLAQLHEKQHLLSTKGKAVLVGMMATLSLN